MRGKGAEGGTNLRNIRITPAYAGKRVSIKKSTHFREGSPPPMRGKAMRSITNFCKQRITPAYAGKRNAPWSGRTPF